MKIEEKAALRLGLNLLGVALVLIAGFLAWQRFGANLGLAAAQQGGASNSAEEGLGVVLVRPG